MKRLALAFLMLATSAHAEVFWYDVEVVEVIDGDTVKVSIPVWPEPLREVNVRVDSIDTPEKGERAKCVKEAEMGAEATSYAKTLAKAGDKVRVKFDTKHRDKFGRILSDVYFSETDTWAKRMISAGLAREYHGEAKGSWCE